jgi:hypothetical protein
MVIRFADGREVDPSKDKVIIDKDGVVIIDGGLACQEYIPWCRGGTVEIDDRKMRDTEKENFMNWLRRMSDRHWKYARETKVSAVRVYHRGKAQAYNIVLSGLQDQSLTSEYEQASAELEGTEK